MLDNPHHARELTQWKSALKMHDEYCLNGTRMWGCLVCDPEGLGPGDNLPQVIGPILLTLAGLLGAVTIIAQAVIYCKSH